MQEWLDYLFREVTPLREVYNDALTTTTNEIGGILITFGFLAWGIICVMMARVSIPSTALKVLIVKIFGWSLIGCGLARAVEAYALWHHYPLLGGIIKLLTGVTVIISTFILPFVIREALKNRSLAQVHEQMKLTEAKLDHAIKLSEELKSNSQ